jgi:hypothetical protein
MALGEYEDAIDTTLIPPGTQYGATRGRESPLDMQCLQRPAHSCYAWQPLTDHS